MRGVRFYVNQATGSDTLDAGRGESESKPFKTIQACLNYVCDNYNFSTYNCTIEVAAGVYNENTIEIPKYNSVTGILIVKGVPYNEDKGYTTKIKSKNVTCIKNEFSNIINLLSIEVELEVDNHDTTRFLSILSNKSGTINVYGCSFILSFLGASEDVTISKYIRAIGAEGGDIAIFAYANNPNKITINNFPNNNFDTLDGILVARYSILRLEGANTLEKDGKIYVQGSLYGNLAAFAYAASSGTILLNPAYTYPTQFVYDNFSGVRYTAISGGKINTSGAGSNYFPGDQEGTIDSSTYSWYK